MSSPSDVATRSLASAPTSMRVTAVTLHVTHGPDAGRVGRVEQPSFVIGVGQGADFRLTDPGVSREHLRLTLTESGVRIRDTGSKNGTFVGGMRIHEITQTSDVALVLGGTTIALAVDTAGAIDLPMSASDRFGAAIGTTPIMRHLFATLEKAAGSDLTVLLEGESGVGKDLIANALHERSGRANKPFVIADCSAIPESLIESELFGHERGAFTGADQARRGLFEAANGGTLFLDEIGELPLEMQPKLLRVLEQREVRPIGAKAPRPVDVRVIAATNRRLAEAARANEFRSDLFYRLAVIKVTVPPLRERSGDILYIARSLLRTIQQNPTADFSPDVASLLVAYAWPGNVRELRNFVERHSVFGPENGRLFGHGAPVSGAPAPSRELSALPYHEARKISLDRFDSAYVTEVLDRADGNVSRAAELAAVGRATFYRILERLSLGKDAT